MSQINTGVRLILSSSGVYSFFQNIMGAKRMRDELVLEYVKPYSGMKLLDVGCGPADILDHLNDIDYYGVDISEQYISSAKKRSTNNKTTFLCGNLTRDFISVLPRFDRVICVGVLHHLNDEECLDLFSISKSLLKLGGSLLSVDPCYDENQNIFAKFIIKNDRGQNVRKAIDYRELALGYFDAVEVEVKHRKWIPYTHCYMKCSMC